MLFPTLAVMAFAGAIATTQNQSPSSTENETVSTIVTICETTYGNDKFTIPCEVAAISSGANAGVIFRFTQEDYVMFVGNKTISGMLNVRFMNVSGSRYEVSGACGREGRILACVGSPDGTDRLVVRAIVE